MGEGHRAPQVSGHYDELSPEQVDAARTMIAALVADDGAAPMLTEMVRDLARLHASLPIEGAMIVIDALLQMIESEMGEPPHVVLDKLARFLAS